MEVHKFPSVRRLNDLFHPTWLPSDCNQRTGDINHQSTSWLTRRSTAPRLAGRHNSRLWDHRVTITTRQHSLIKGQK